MRPLALLVLLLLVVARGAAAQATFDAAANAASASSPLTLAHTTGSGSNRAMVVFVAVGCNSGSTAPLTSTVTYATTQNLTQIKHQAGSGAHFYVDLWALPAGTPPTTGTNNVVATLASSLNIACGSQARMSVGVITAAGVDQTTTFTDSNGAAAGSGTTASMTLSSSGGTDLGVDMACAGSPFLSTTETVKWNTGDTNTACNEYGGAIAAGGDISFSWPINGNDSWAMVGAALKAAGGGGGAAPCVSTLRTLGVSECGH